MQELIDLYKKRLKTAQNLLAQLNNIEDKDAWTRILAKVNCYNYFIFELELLKEKYDEELEMKQNDGSKINSTYDFVGWKGYKSCKLPKFRYETVFISSN